jgi:TonB family protein
MGSAFVSWLVATAIVAPAPSDAPSGDEGEARVREIVENLGGSRWPGDLGADELVPRQPEASPPVPARSNLPPAYPEALRKRGISGSIELELRVDANGVTRGIKILEKQVVGARSSEDAERAERLLVESVVVAARTWRFVPATREGRPVEVWWPVSVPFELELPGERVFDDYLTRCVFDLAPLARRDRAGLGPELEEALAALERAERARCLDVSIDPASLRLSSLLFRGP